MNGCDGFVRESDIIKDGKYKGCDTSYVYFDSISNENRNVCLLNGLESYNVINSNNDTHLTYNEISTDLIEKIYFEQSSVSQVVNILRFGEKENVNLSFNILDSQINESESSFFKFRKRNDSLFFKFSGYDINGSKIDSIWVSEAIDFFPGIKKLFGIKYEYKTSNLYEWIYLPEVIIKNKKLVVVGFSNFTDSDGLGGVMYGPYYLDSTIIKWNNKVLSLYSLADIP
jgi:hypothetical protein